MSVLEVDEQNLSLRRVTINLTRGGSSGPLLRWIDIVKKENSSAPREDRISHSIIHLRKKD